ncbi:MAG: PQQ-like beta-propeller repeat protein [Verrucomicrobiales bacterium]|nr:PQQ-like beta-propeller repeat protein [Verrucomicrobiales bacterium]MBT5847443.1 PQQ-like beta-propeller repeat protein [Verrucomicrobiales bacterium]
MKQILLMIAVVALVGCGKEESVQPSASNTKATKPEPPKAKTTEGSKLWEFDTGLGWLQSSPAIGPDGTVYVGSLDYKLYAINTDSKGLAKSPWPMRGQNARHTGRAPTK